MIFLNAGKQQQVDKINARLEVKGADHRVYLDERGKMQKRKLGGT